MLNKTNLLHILFCRVARVVAPKKAALKEAEAELAVAMEVGVYNGLSISFQDKRSGHCFTQSSPAILQKDVDYTLDYVWRLFS